MLRVEGFSRRGAFEDISFTLHAGEVLTFFGLVGAGRTEVARALMGLDSGATGAVLINGPAGAHPPAAARPCTPAWPTCPKTARTRACSWTRRSRENFLAPNLSQVAPGGWLHWDILQRG